MSKNSANVISNPSHNFLMVMMDTSRRRSSSKLYTVDGVTPERFANSLGLIFLSRHKSRTLSATTSLTFKMSPHWDCKKKYANACTHLRIFPFSDIILSLQKDARLPKERGIDAGGCWFYNAKRQAVQKPIKNEEVILYVFTFIW